MRLSVRSFRLHSYGFEAFGETASCLCRPPHTSQHSTKRRNDKSPTAERHTAKHCAYSPSADSGTMEPETDSFAATLTGGRLTFSVEYLGDPLWYTGVELRLQRWVKWEWRLSIRSAERKDEILSSSLSAGALPTDTTRLRDCVCVKHRAENIKWSSTYLVLFSVK